MRCCFLAVSPSPTFSPASCRLWFWLLITVFSDLFRRHDISGWARAIWVIALIIFPYLGIFIYLITQHRGMAERQSQRVQQAREDITISLVTALPMRSRSWNG